MTREEATNKGTSGVQSPSTATSPSPSESPFESPFELPFNRENISYARLNFIRFSPQKLTRISRLIKRKTYEESLLILAFLPYKICPTIIKVLRSAAANGQVALRRSAPPLTTKEGVFFVIPNVQKGPLMKRFRPAAKGLGHQFLRRSSHLVIALDYFQKIEQSCYT